MKAFTDMLNNEKTSNLYINDNNNPVFVVKLV